MALEAPFARRSMTLLSSFSEMSSFTDSFSDGTMSSRIHKGEEMW